MEKDVQKTKEWEDLTFQFLGKYFQEKDLAHHQKASFDYFIHHRLSRIVEEDPIIEVKIKSDEIYRVIFGQVYVDKPYIVDEKRVIRYITPNEARLRDLTYSSVVSITVQTFLVKIEGEGNERVIEKREYFKVPLARLPIMVYSSKCNLYSKTIPERWELGECEYDYGGYFIIKGKERVLVAQERINYNVVYVFEAKVNSKYQYVAEIRSMSDETGHSVLLQMKHHKNDERIVMTLPYIKNDIPIGWIFRACDFSVDMICHCFRANLPKSVLEGKKGHKVSLWLRQIKKDMYNCESREDAIEKIAQFSTCAVVKEKKKAFIEQIIQNEMLPHLGISSTVFDKMFFISYMMSRLFLVYVGERPFDDRDHLMNKRIEVGGILVGELFRTLYKRFLRILQPQLQKRQDIELAISRINIITQGLKHCFATGNWGIPKSSYMRTGVSQVLSRLTYLGTLSHLRRILIPVGKEGKNTKIRQLHASQIGYFCPSETPEGHSAGIVKNFSMLCEISPKFENVYIRSILDTFFKEDDMILLSNEKNMKTCGQESTKVFYNGIIYGWINTSEPHVFYKKLLDAKIKHIFHHTISISWNSDLREIHFFTDEGRLLRPLWNIENFPTHEELREKSWDELVQQGKLCWIDPHEMENHVVAYECNKIEKYHDMMEIHPSLMMGVCVSLIPFQEHTQSPRLCYVASMAKQALGVYASNNDYRSDTITYILHNTEEPIIKSHYSEYSGYNKLPSGNNLIVAIACYTGFNQEDSVIFNKSSIERGVFRTTAYKTIVVEEKKRTSHFIEVIGPIPDECKTQSHNYSKLGDNGIIKPNVYVGCGDVIVSRMIHRPSRQGKDIQETSYFIRSGEEGYIDRVFISTTPDGYKMVKIKIRQLKIPEIGDKVCSRCAQKGTIGMIIAQEDMPFTQSGIVPDLIMNPHAIPSRMTMNQLLECLGAKSAVSKGIFRYSTAFTSHSQNIVDEFMNALHECGFEKHGHEFMTNGFTGESILSDIFIGPTYYHRLKHLVSGKIHARNHGNVQMLFRQPCEGRSKDGGLRFGEMERDSVVGHTPIPLSCGISVKIVEMYETGWEVLGWCPKENGIIHCRQTEFLEKKELHECVKVFFQDGRTLECTLKHPLLTSENAWVYAKDLIINETRVKTSVLYPLCDLNKEIEECNGWSMDLSTITLSTDTREEFLRTLAFMRLLGLVITDGHLPEKGTGTIFLGHEIDVHNCVSDIRKVFYVDDVKVRNDQGNYIIHLPASMAYSLKSLPGIVCGNKTKQPASLPLFFCHDDKIPPLPLIREFLGGMFGGDGHTCYLGMHRGKRDILTSVSFSRSTIQQHMKSLDTYMSHIIHLFKRCGINDITIQKAKETTNSKSKSDLCDNERTYSLTLHLSVDELIPFSEKIGFRYCVHKSVRLDAGVSYKRFRNSVARQHNWLVDRVLQITNYRQLKSLNPTKNIQTKKAIEQAVKELLLIEPLYHEYAIPSGHDISDHVMKGTTFGKFRSSSFPNAHEFMKEIDAVDWFIFDSQKSDTTHISYGVKRCDNCLPTMNLKVIAVKPIGEQKVYDIQVDKTESFLANGVVAHNCMISHGTSRFLVERLFDMSDPFQIPVCSQCGSISFRLDSCDTCLSNSFSSSSSSSSSSTSSALVTTTTTHSHSVHLIPIPYACKLLFQELMAFGIRLQIKIDPSSNTKTLKILHPPHHS